MKKCICIAALLTCAFALHAESLVTMHAPFAFVASGKILPAGDYRVQPLAPGVLLIAGEDSGSRVLALATVSAGSSTPAVVFDSTGPEPVLTSVTTSAGTWRLSGPPQSHGVVSLRSKP